jgi:hypothetical protein
VITIRFIGGNDLISRGIRLAEYGFWATHVETLMPDGTLLGARQWRRPGEAQGLRQGKILEGAVRPDSSYARIDRCVAYFPAGANRQAV